MSLSGFTIPTLATLINRISDDLNSRLPGEDSRIRRSVLWCLARVLAGAALMLYKFISYIADQLFADLAADAYLDRLADIWGLTRNPAVKAAGSITFTGLNGSTIPAGAVTQRLDGVQYVTDALATIPPALTVDVPSTAVLAGDAGNCAGATQVSLIAPLAGVNSAALVNYVGMTGGLDTESDASLRARLLHRIGYVPGGGTEEDWEQWTLDTPTVDVVTAWIFPLELGLGTVVVRFVKEGVGVAMLPNAGDVAAVRAYLDTVKPVTANSYCPTTYVVAPTALSVWAVAGLWPYTAAVVAAAKAETIEMLARESAPGATIYNSRFQEALAATAALERFVLHEVNGVAGGNVACAANELPFLVTFWTELKTFTIIASNTAWIVIAQDDVALRYTIDEDAYFTGAAGDFAGGELNDFSDASSDKAISADGLRACLVDGTLDAAGEYWRLDPTVAWGVAPGVGATFDVLVLAP